MVTSCAPLLKTYMMYTGDAGIYTYTFEHEKKPDCPVCGNQAIKLTIVATATLQYLIDQLLERSDLYVHRFAYDKALNIL
jgi:ubiquitin-activating enzyme E1 C